MPPITPNTPDTNNIVPLERVIDDNALHLFGPVLTSDKNIAVGSLVTARCCFGTAAIDDQIYVVGNVFLVCI